MSQFVNMLIRVMKIADFEHKKEVVRALMVLHQDEGLPNAEVVQKALLGILGPKRGAPSCLNEHQKEFITSSLTLMQSLGVYDKDFYVELMVQFMESDMDVR